MVNEAPREFPRVLMESPGRILKVPLVIFLSLRPREIPWGTLNILPIDAIEYSKESP